MNPFLWKRYQKQLHIACLVMSHCLTMYQYIYLNIWIDSSNPVGSSNVTGKGGSKYGVHQGNGTIWRMYHFCFFRYIFLHTYESLLVKEISKTTLSIENVSCHVSLSHYSTYVSIYIYKYLIDSSNQVGSSNVIERGGSKYGVHQGNGAIWRMYHFIYTNLFLWKRYQKQLFLYIYIERVFRHVSSSHYLFTFEYFLYIYVYI